MQARLQAEEALKEAATCSDASGCLTGLLAAESAHQLSRAPAAEDADAVAKAGLHMKLRVQCLVLVLSRLQREELLPQLPAVMPVLLGALAVSDASTRRAAVLAYVSVHIVVGPEAVKPWALQLTAMQAQLVQVYLGRQRSLQAQIVRTS